MSMASVETAPVPLGRKHRRVVIAMVVLAIAMQWAWIAMWLAHDERASVGNTLFVAVVLSLVIVILGFWLYGVLGQVRESEQELARMATTDLLTGVLNRRGFMTAAAQEYTRTRRYDRPLSVLTIDPDHFKTINDRYGHTAGDSALSAFTVAWQAVLRTTDLVGLLGGEQFAILLPETALASARELAERVRQAAEDVPFDFLPAGEHITVSVGVAAVRLTDSSIEHALARADEELRRAKSDGRNCVRSSDEEQRRPV
jgi:diguanylate cyclase (GGDEF)-like protein